MPIKVQCACGKAFAAKDELAGKTVKCPGCQKPLKIPGGAAPAGSSGQAGSQTGRRQAGAARPRSRSRPRQQPPHRSPVRQRRWRTSVRRSRPAGRGRGHASLPRLHRTDADSGRGLRQVRLQHAHRPADGDDQDQRRSQSAPWPRRGGRGPAKQSRESDRRRCSGGQEENQGRIAVVGLPDRLEAP